MSFRVITISKRAKLDLKLSCLVIRTDEETKTIHLSEISILMIESTAVSITAALLCELVENKIKVIFCDEKRNPTAQITPFYGSHDTSLKVRNQIGWSQLSKEQVWTEIVTQKIKNQYILLRELGLQEMQLLEKYIPQIEHNDATNREGHAAKVYFNALFGKEFSRSVDNNINAALNYGYAIILSALNREICANGYITQLGLFHDNVHNRYNLGCDLMEPFRPIIDKAVVASSLNKFEHSEKMELVNLLNSQVLIDGKTQYLNNAIKIYCKSVFDALNASDISLIRFTRNEL